MFTRHWIIEFMKQVFPRFFRPVIPLFRELSGNSSDRGTCIFFKAER